MSSCSFPHVITNLTAVRRTYDCLSPLRHSPGNLIVISWLFPKRQRTGNYATIFVNYPGYPWFSHWWNVLTYNSPSLLLLLLFFTASTELSGQKYIMCWICTLVTINYFNIQHFSQWLLPKFYVWGWRWNS